MRGFEDGYLIRRDACERCNQDDCARNAQAPAPTSVLDEARRIVHKRGMAYADPAVNHERIAALWSVILQREVTALEVVYCMAAVKLARLVATPDHRDSIVDLAGYAECAGYIIDQGGHPS